MIVASLIYVRAQREKLGFRKKRGYPHNMLDFSHRQQKLIARALDYANSCK